MRSIILLPLMAMLFGILGATPAEGRVWYVAGGAAGSHVGTTFSPFPNIHDGLDRAASGDTVLLADGTYTFWDNDNLDFHGRRVVLRSASDDPERCVINCNSTNHTMRVRGAWFHSGEDSLCIVRGLTVTNGDAVFGGGVLCEGGASPKLVNCVFVNCHADSAGGGVSCSGGQPIFENCVFQGNYSLRGGGVDVTGASPQFRNCTFRDNLSYRGGGLACTDCPSPVIVRGCVLTDNNGTYEGGAIYVGGSSMSVASCTLDRNLGTVGSGINVSVGSTLTASRTIIAYGTPGAAILCQTGGAATVTCSNIFGNAGGDYVGCLADRFGVDGNIRADPQFCDEVHDNYGIWAASSCAAAFAGDCGLIGASAPSCGTLFTGFTDVTAGALAGGGHGSGLAVGDYDADGDDDLYVVNDGTPNRLLRNDGGGAFTEATPALLAEAGHGRAAAWADMDNDGDLDLCLAKDNEANRLFRNLGAGAFEEQPLYPQGNVRASRAVSWVDYDLDGMLDLYVVNEGGGNRLLRGWGEPGSSDWNLDAVGDPVISDTGDNVAAAWGDADGDGDQDVYLSRTFQANALLRNQPQFGFESATTRPLNDVGSGAGATWGDFDNDGRLDLYLANRTTPDKLFRQVLGGFALVTGGGFGQTRQGTSVAWADFDNDGDLDLFLGRSPGSDALLRNEGAGVFTELAPVAAGRESPTTGAAWLDFDNDGDLDLYIVRDGAPNALLRNDAAAGNHWLQLVLRGTTANRSAIGARVRAVAGGSAQIREVTAGDGYRSQGSLVVSFGLGAATAVDSVEIRWPGGSRQVLTGVAADQRLAVTEGAPSPVDPGLPGAATITLFPCRPNPFNPSTTIAYDLPRAGATRLAVYDMGGRLVRVVVAGTVEPAGRHEARWNGRDESGRAVAAGTYVCRLESGGLVARERLTLIK